VVTFKELEKETNQANAVLLNQLQIALDRHLEDIDTMGLQISLNPSIRSLDSIEKPIDNFQQYNILKACQYLQTLKYANSFISDLFVYSKGTDSILFDTRHLDTELAYDYFFTNTEMTYAQWMDMLRSHHKKDFVKIGNKIAYVQSLTGTDPKDDYGTIVFYLNEDLLKEAIKNTRLADNAVVMIMDQNNSILSSISQMGLSYTPDYSKLKSEKGISYDTLNGKKNVVSHIDSQASDWMYLIITPYEVFGEKMSYVRRLITLSFVICLILGSVVVYFFLKRNYNPVNNILQSLGKYSKYQFRKGSNEYSFIQDAISKTLDENEKISHSLNLQSREMRSNFLRRLINGTLETKLSLQDTLASYNIFFISDYFAVEIFYMNHLNQFLKDDTTMSDADKLKLVQFAIANVVEELTNQENRGYVVELDENIMVCLVNFAQEEAEDANNGLKRIADEAQQFFEEKFDVHFTIGFSRVHQGILGIHDAYCEAMEVMEYKLVIGSNKVIGFDDMVPVNETKYNYYYPLEVEYQLINYIKIGDIGKAREIVNKIFENNFSNISITVQMAKCLMYNFVGTMVKTLNDMTNVLEGNFIEEQNVVKRLLESESVLNMKTELMDILEEVCAFIVSKKKTKNGVAQRLISYIDDNYHDCNLSISSIGDHFDITPAYISTIFKQETGEGLLDFINRTRLEKAKQLLREDKISIAQIAQEVGFTSSGALIRTFKRYEGVTPGKFKEM
jgi:AraC-type DNA-binding domain-containing proteins